MIKKNYDEKNKKMHAKLDSFVFDVWFDFFLVSFAGGRCLIGLFIGYSQVIAIHGQTITDPKSIYISQIYSFFLAEQSQKEGTQTVIEILC